MVIVLLMMLFLALLSVGLWVYAHTVLTSAAAQAARYAANADVPDEAASDRARDILSGGLTGSAAPTVRCTAQLDGDLVGVRCTMASPGLIPLLNGILPDVTATGHAAAERP